MNRIEFDLNIHSFFFHKYSKRISYYLPVESSKPTVVQSARKEEGRTAVLERNKFSSEEF